MTPGPDDILAVLGRPRRQRRAPVGDQDWLEGPAGRMAYERHGMGPAVLLVHGWESSAREWTSLVPALTAAGVAAIVPDLPAHGASDGETVSARSAGEALRALEAREGPFLAVLAHSFGCVATTLACEAGLQAGALVFFAPPADQADQVRRLCARNGLTPEAAETVLARVREAGMELIDLPARVAARPEPLLVIHASDDEMTPLSGAQGLVAAWPGARLLEMDGLGHNGALRDRAAIAAALRFAIGA